jgi:hypothetical protein
MGGGHPDSDGNRVLIPGIALAGRQAGGGKVCGHVHALGVQLAGGRRPTAPGGLGWPGEHSLYLYLFLFSFLFSIFLFCFDLACTKSF